MAQNRLTDRSYLARYFLWNAVGVDDYQLFPARTIENAAPVFHFQTPGEGEDIQPALNEACGGEAIDAFLTRNGTTAFLIIRGDKILYERYFQGYERTSICTSFSVAKSFTSALVGIALEEKLIQGLDDPLTKYLPEMAPNAWAEISIRHLVGMCSGLGYNASGFFPWNDEPKVYYSLDLRRLAGQARSSELPGRRFHYNNYNLVLLGMILERVSGGSVSTYIQEKIWKPLGMEFPASWSLDSQESGMEKMESGLNARAVDFAKFGQLYLRQGDWNGRQIIPESWVVASTRVEPGAGWTHYKYLWWMSRTGKGRFTAVGNLGQFIYIAPDKNCAVLRFGQGKPGGWKMAYPQLFARIADLL